MRRLTAQAEAARPQATVPFLELAVPEVDDDHGTAVLLLPVAPLCLPSLPLAPRTHQRPFSLCPVSRSSVNRSPELEQSRGGGGDRRCRSGPR